LKYKRGEDDKVSKRVWKVVKIKVEEVRMVEVKRKREKERRRK